MNYRTTIGLCVLVGLLATALWLIPCAVAPTQHREMMDTRVLDVDLMHVDGLVVQQDDDAIEIARRGNTWWIVRPIEARADEAVIRKLLSTSEALVCVETITREQREHRALSLGDYALDIPHTSITYRTPLGACRLLIGNDARLGKRTYVRIDGMSDVMLAEGEIRSALPESLEALRDHLLLHGQAARVTRLEMERPDGGFVQLLRGAEGWMLHQPVREPADPAAVNTLLDALFSARIERFVWDPAAGVVPAAADAVAVVATPSAPVESYGLAADTATAKLRVWLTGDELGRELTLGKKSETAENRIYGMVGDSGSVFTLDAALLKQCQIPVDALRSRILVRMDPGRIRYLAVKQGDRKLTLGYTRQQGWSIQDPIQWPADREAVSDVLRTLTAAKIQSFVDEPATNTISASDDAALHILLDTTYPPQRVAAEDDITTTADGIDHCELVAIDNGSDDQMLVQITGRAGRVHVRRDALVFLPEATALPFAFFDRTVLAVAPDQVQRLTLRRGETEQGVERDAEGSWTTVGDEPGKPDASVLSDILFHVSNLRAVRVADQHPRDLGLYGLDTPNASLTIGLAGGDAIQKTILMGASAGASMRYAMIQGQDVVFVLDQGLADLLLHDLITVAGAATHEP